MRISKNFLPFHSLFGTWEGFAAGPFLLKADLEEWLEYGHFPKENREKLYGTVDEGTPKKYVSIIGQVELHLSQHRFLTFHWKKCEPPSTGF